ncbi:unnamed protein product [Prorocentrum cordatum]|uniref:Uncharacterized protein n=1 Tax=Prorocentrum cordatum TaxID=2364126 RepID=A0ABN9YK82_9DINO|nr:unnamed protein product [Polarella glacialis]CAK0911939.1 unnamed protein product [Polarella glacialis]
MLLRGVSAANLIVSGTCKEHFSSALTVLDEALFSQVRGSADGQQIWECLAALVALRLWRHVWGQRSLTLRIRGNSMTMLSLIVNLRPAAGPDRHGGRGGVPRRSSCPPSPSTSRG